MKEDVVDEFVEFVVFEMFFIEVLYFVFLLHFIFTYLLLFAFKDNKFSVVVLFLLFDATYELPRPLCQNLLLIHICLRLLLIIMIR